MTTRGCARAAGAPHGVESGFVLIGVVIFVLALTILGLSLFSLSGFETQFLEESHRDLQAFYYASGGLERACQVLETQNTLDAVRLSPQVEGVTWANARYVDTGESTGTVDWTGHSGQIAIQVRGTDREKTRLLEAYYQPSSLISPYVNLIASYSYVIGGMEKNSILRLELNGPLRQNDSNTSWAAQAPGTHPITIGGVPFPQVDDYIATHGPYETPVVTPVPGQNHYYLNLGGVHLYRLDNNAGGVFGFRDSDPVTLHLDAGGGVPNTAIWVFPTGAEFERTISVEGSSADRLVMVAGRSNSTELAGWGLADSLGLHIQGGIDSHSVPVILVSNGAIRIDQHRDSTETLTAAYLSVFAKSVGLAGPALTTSSWLYHNSGMDAAVIDPLAAAGLLPNTGAASIRRLALVSGTWREIR